MKVIPFLAVCYMIAGMASLGLPGLSGFVAEMTIFNGAFQNPDMFHRVATIIACSSIVVTAVYILRVVGMMLLGPLKDEHHAHLDPAKWYEKLSTVSLIVAVAAIGIAPLWLSNTILDSLSPIMGALLK
jgi:NADH-quinone oxidoreductase subunit M